MPIKKFDDLDQRLMEDFKQDEIISPKNISQRNPNIDLVTFEYLLSNIGFTQNITEEELNNNVKEIIQEEKEKFYLSGEAEKLKYKIKESSSPVTIIDKIKIYSDDDSLEFLANTANSGLSKVIVYKEAVDKNQEALGNYIWAEIDVNFENSSEDEKESGYTISNLTHLSTQDFDSKKSKFKEIWKKYSLEDKVNILLRSIGIEPDLLSLKEKYQEHTENSLFRAKMHLIKRLIPFVENNYNLMEIGEKGIGKSYLQKLSLNSISYSVSDVTYSDLFGDNRYNKNTAEVGKNDVIFIDEISKGEFKCKNLIEKMNTYLTDGSYNAGSKGNKELIPAKTSFVFTGNNKKDVETLLRRTKYNLFTPCPGSIGDDETVQDRIHFYIPSWELNEFPDDIKTNHLGLTLDFLFKLFHSLREEDYTTTLEERRFQPTGKIKKRDINSINKTVSGLIKLLNISDENVNNQELEEYLKIALEGRNRVILQKKSVSYSEGESISFVNQNNLRKMERFINNQNIEKIPLEMTLINTEKELEFKNHEVKLIHKRKMNEFNIELFRKLLNRMEIREKRIIAVNKGFFDSEIYEYNFELVVKKITGQININIYEGNQDPQPSQGLEPLFKGIAKDINLEVNGHILDAYIKTYTVIRDKIIKLKNRYPNIQQKLQLPENRFLKLGRRHFRDLDFIPSVNDQIKLDIFYTFGNHKDNLVCKYGGIDIEISWNPNSTKFCIEYALNRNIRDYL